MFIDARVCGMAHEQRKDSSNNVFLTSSSFLSSIFLISEITVQNKDLLKIVAVHVLL